MSRRRSPVPKSTTIADVARVAGVSIATVSRALTSPAVVTASTRERVLQAVGRTGYQPNAAARMLRSRKSMMAMVVVPDIANPFFSEVLRGIEETLAASGYGVIIANLDRSRAKDAHYVVACSQRAGGRRRSCCAAACSAVAGRRWRRSGCRSSRGARSFPGPASRRWMWPTATRRSVATRHLLDLGHRRLAYVSGPPRNILDRERRAGFFDALRTAGIAREAARRLHRRLHLPQRRRGGRRDCCACLRRSAPTAVFAANDEMAIGLVKRFGERGLAVPRDVSVVGFDAIDFSDYCEPPLTTVRQPRARDRRCRRAPAGRGHEPGAVGAGTQIRLPAELIVRGTTAPPARRRGSASSPAGCPGPVVSARCRRGLSTILPASRHSVDGGVRSRREVAAVSNEQRAGEMRRGWRWSFDGPARGPARSRHRFCAELASRAGSQSPRARPTRDRVPTWRSRRSRASPRSTPSSPRSCPMPRSAV